MPAISVDKGEKASVQFAVMDKGEMLCCGETAPGETTVTGLEFVTGKDAGELVTKLAAGMKCSEADVMAKMAEFKQNGGYPRICSVRAGLEDNLKEAKIWRIE